MEKKKRVRFTTTTYDRVHFLINDPQYLQDLEDIKKGFNLERYMKFFTKYKLNDVILDPEWVKNTPRKVLENTALFNDGFIVRTIFANEPKMINKEVDNRLYKQLVPKNLKDKIKKKDVVFCQYDVKPILRDGRYLTVEIDLKQKKENIKATLEMLVDQYKKYAPKHKGRESDPELDHWEVYYMHKENGLTFAEIARKLSGLKDNSLNNPPQKAYYKKVIRAYKKVDRPRE